jgi:hypothetical protein
VYPYLYDNTNYVYEEIDTDSFIGSSSLWGSSLTADGIFSVSAVYGDSDFTGSPILRGDLYHLWNLLGPAGSDILGNSSNGFGMTETSFIADFTTAASGKFDKFILPTDDSGSYYGTKTGYDYNSGSDFVWILAIDSSGGTHTLYWFNEQTDGDISTFEAISTLDYSASTIYHYLDSAGSDATGTTGATTTPLVLTFTDNTAYATGSDVTTANVHAKMLWDNAANQQLFKFMLGNDLADVTADDLVANTLTVPNGSGILINNVSLGTYADYTNALAAATS